MTLEELIETEQYEFTNFQIETARRWIRIFVTFIDYDFSIKRPHDMIEHAFVDDNGEIVLEWNTRKIRQLAVYVAKTNLDIVRISSGGELEHELVRMPYDQHFSHNVVPIANWFSLGAELREELSTYSCRRCKQQEERFKRRA